MQQRKVFQLLRLFGPADLKGFQGYLSNSYFNQSKTVLEFFLRFRRLLLDAPDGAEVTVEEFLEGAHYSRRRMDKLCSKLNALASSYLAQKAFEDDAQTQDQMLLRAVEQRDEGHRESLRLYERLIQQNETEKASPANFVRALDLRWGQLAYTIKGRETRQLWQENFLDLHALLEQYYHLQKLKLLCASANIRKIFQQEAPAPDMSFLDALDAQGAAQQLQPLARAYYLVSRMLVEEGGDSYFQELLLLLGEKAADFTPGEATEIYNFALNFCIRNSNRGRLDYLAHASALYEQLLTNRLILHNGELLPQQMKNIVALQCSLGKLDWVQSFLQDFAEDLPADAQAGALRYNEAVLAFYRGAYAHAIESFKQVIADPNDDVFYGIDARVFLWKSYFEGYAELSMEEVDEMHRLYDSFRLYIERNAKISTAHKLHYRNFIREFKRFMEILRGDPVSASSLDRLESELWEMDFVSNKGWFLEKIKAVRTNL